MRLNQVSWTNPLTNKILLEAGVNVNTQLCDFSYHRYVAGHKELPRVLEVGETVGMDDVSARVNTTAGNPTAAVPSAALNNGLGMAAESRDLNNLRTRASLSPSRGAPPSSATTAAFPSSDTTRSTTRGRPTATTGQRRPARPRHRAATRASISRAIRPTRRWA